MKNCIGRWSAVWPRTCLYVMKSVFLSSFSSWYLSFRTILAMHGDGAFGEKKFRRDGTDSADGDVKISNPFDEEVFKFINLAYRFEGTHF